MNHESDLPEQPSEREIDEMADAYRDSQREEELRRQQEQREIDERMHQVAKEMDAQRESEAPVKEPPVFEIPAHAQKKLDARTAQFNEAYDRLDSQGMYTRLQILERLAEQGLFPPDTAEEIETKEVKRISNHASKSHQPRSAKSKTLRRPLGPTQREIADSDKRVESEYGEPGSDA